MEEPKAIANWPINAACVSGVPGPALLYTSRAFKNVKKVVKLFNYLMVRPAKEVEKDNKRKEEAEKRAELEAKKAELEAKQNELNQQLYELGSD